jgi:hypothetical protein
MKEIRLNLSNTTWSELEQLASQSGRPMTYIVRLGLSLAKLAIEETQQKHIIVVATPEGKALNQVVLPTSF